MTGPLVLPRPGKLASLGPLVALTAFGLCLLLPGLGGFGLWEPWERGVAAQATAPDALQLGPAPLALLPALGMRLFGIAEGSARLPGVLVAIATLLAVAWAGGVLQGRRAGLVAATVLVAMPLFILQARQLTSDMPLLLGTALVLGGFGRLAGPASTRSHVLAGSAALLGLALSAVAGGALVGVVAPCLAFGAAWWLSDLKMAPGTPRALARAITLAGAALAVTTLARSYQAGQTSWLLGGVPVYGPSTRSFESALRVLGFGLFPWSALALLALLSPLLLPEERSAPEERPRRFATLLPVLVVVFGLASATLQLRLIGQAHLSLLPAVAIVLGRWLTEPGATAPVNRVLGLVVATGTLLVARDLWHAPEELFSVHLPARIGWPPDLSWRPLFLTTGVLFAAAVLARYGVDPTTASGRWRRLASGVRRAAVPVLLVSAGLFSAGVAHLAVPALSRHLSQKQLLDTARALGGEGTSLALYRIPRSDSGSFAPGERVRLFEVDSVGALAAAFRAEAGLFAMIPRGDLAAVDDAFAEAAMSYAVADASSSRFLLLAGRLPTGVPDQNPLADLRFRPTAGELPPWPPPRMAVAARYGDAVELYGADFPTAVRRPGSFPLVLYFRALGRPPAGYKIFVHVEQPGALVRGDHPPLGGALPTERWRPGDHIRDRHLVTVPLMTTSAGRYTIYVGFWPGGDTVRRLPVTAGLTHDGRDRVALGTIQIK